MLHTNTSQGSNLDPLKSMQQFAKSHIKCTVSCHATYAIYRSSNCLLTE